ncbi:MAG: BrnA antitoxin family protein [Rhodospirillales bacterium]
MPDEDIDTSDIPEILDWSQAERGRFFRPIKKSVTIRLDADVLDWFKSQGGRYQTQVNQALRQYMLSHPRKAG